MVTQSKQAKLFMRDLAILESNQAPDLVISAILGLMFVGRVYI